MRNLKMSQDSGHNFDHINSWWLPWSPLKNAHVSAPLRCLRCLRSPTDSIHLKKGDHLNDLQTETSYFFLCLSFGSPIFISIFIPKKNLSYPGYTWLILNDFNVDLGI